MSSNESKSQEAQTGLGALGWAHTQMSISHFTREPVFNCLLNFRLVTKSQAFCLLNKQNIAQRGHSEQYVSKKHPDIEHQAVQNEIQCCESVGRQGGFLNHPWLHCQSGNQRGEVLEAGCAPTKGHWGLTAAPSHGSDFRADKWLTN